MANSKEKQKLVRVCEKYSLTKKRGTWGVDSQI